MSFQILKTTSLALACALVFNTQTVLAVFVTSSLMLNAPSAFAEKIMTPKKESQKENEVKGGSDTGGARTIVVEPSRPITNDKVIRKAIREAEVIVPFVIQASLANYNPRSTVDFFDNAKNFKVIPQMESCLDADQKPVVASAAPGKPACISIEMLWEDRRINVGNILPVVVAILYHEAAHVGGVSHDQKSEAFLDRIQNRVVNGLNPALNIRTIHNLLNDLQGTLDSSANTLKYLTELLNNKDFETFAMLHMAVGTELSAQYHKMSTLTNQNQLSFLDENAMKALRTAVVEVATLTAFNVAQNKRAQWRHNAWNYFGSRPIGTTMRIGELPQEAFTGDAFPDAEIINIGYHDINNAKRAIALAQKYLVVATEDLRKALVSVMAVSNIRETP